MLMRTDPFRDLDRLARHTPAAHPATMPMDAWCEGDEFVVELDLPGIDPASLNIDLERNILTVRAERRGIEPGRPTIAAERPRGVFSRQLLLGDTLDTDQISADYSEGVLRLRIPLSDKVKPRKIRIGHRTTRTGERNTQQSEPRELAPA